MPLDSKTQQIYTTLKGGGADVGTEQEFNDYFFAKGEQGYKNRLEVWNTLKGGGADVGDRYEDFRDWLGLSPRSNPVVGQQAAPQQTHQQKPQATTPTQPNYPQRPEMDQQDILSGSALKNAVSQQRQKVAEVPNQGMEMARQEEARLQQPIYQTNTPADQSVIKTQGQWEDEVRQSAAKNAKDLFGIGVDYEVGRVMDEATKRWEKAFDPRGMVGEGSEMFALRRANEEIDPERLVKDLSSELQSRIGGWMKNEDKKEAIIAEANKLGVSPEDYANMVVDNIVSQAQQRLDKKITESYMPKGTADYILNGLHDSLIGTLFDMGTMTKGQRQMMQKANQQFSEQNKKDNYWGGTVTDLVRGGVGFMGDAPVFGALGKVASPMVRGTGALLEKMGINTTLGMSDAAFQRLSQAVLNNSSWLQRMKFGAGRAIAGSAYNFGLYEGIGNVVNDLSVGEDTSLGGLAGDFIEGFSKGSAKGAVLGAFSRPAQAVSPRFGIRPDMKLGEKILVGTGKGALATGNIMAEGLGFTAGEYLVDEEARNRVKESDNPMEVILQDTMENTMMAGIFKMMNGHNMIHPVESLKKAFEPSSDSRFNFQNWQKKEIEDAYGGKFISTMEDIAHSADAERNTKMSRFYEDFMNRNDISWDTKNKVSAILTGNMAMFPPIPSRISIDEDKKEVVAMGRNGEVLFRRAYENKEDAEAIKAQLDMSRDEKMLHNLIGTFLVKDEEGKVNPDNQKQLDDAIADVGYETSLNKEGMFNALNKAPEKRSEMEQFAIDELYNRLYDVRFPENQPHPAQDHQNGRDIADKTLDINELDPEKNPNGVEPGKYDQLTQAYDEANKAIEAAFKNNDSFYQFVKEQRANGLSDGEIALEARKMAFSEEEAQTLIDYERAKEQIDGYIELTGERIGEYVSNEVSGMSFKGQLDGQPVKDRFVRVVDEEGNEYYLRTGNVSTDENGRLVSTDGSEAVIVRGVDGKDKMVLADSMRLAPEDPANPMRDNIAAYSALRTAQLEEAISLAIDSEGKLQQPEEPKSQGQMAYEQEQGDVDQNGGLVRNELADQMLSETLRGSLHTLGRKIGKKIQIVTKDELKQINPSAPDNARGMRSEDNKTLYLVSDYVKDNEYMQRFVTGHELTHSIKTESGDKKVWNDFVDAVKSHMGDKAFDEAVKSAEELYERSGVHLDRDAAIEEVCSDWAGDNLTQDEASIRHIVESVERAGHDAVTFTQRIKQLFEDMIAAFTGSGRTLGSKEKEQLEKLIKARDLWEQMYNECVAKNEARDKDAEERRMAEQKAADERKAREEKGVIFGEDGEADYTKMTPEATISDLTEQAGPELVDNIIGTMLDNANKVLKSIKDVKPASDKPSDVIAAAKETATQRKAAQEVVDYWKDVQKKHKEIVATAEAEAKRQAEEDAKRQAEETARLQAEAERQERLSTPEGRASEIAKAKVVDRPKVAKEIYGEAFNEDMTPNGVDEYVMAYFSGKIPELGKGFIDTDSFEEETGHKVEGFSGDSKAYYNYLAGRGKGKTLAQVAEEMWHSMPEALKGTTDDVAIKNKVAELLTSAQKATEIRDALLNSRIREAERTLAGEAENIEGQEIPEKSAEPVDGGLPFVANEKRAPFSLEKTAEQGGASFSLVEDPAEKERLDKEKKIKVYRSVQLDKEGNARSPIASKLGKGSGKTATSSIQMGSWEKADEHPELADENGKIVLDKGDGNGTLTVAYNPYIHTSRSMINDQFSSAWKRDNIVVIETEVPESELTSGYHADKAKDAVGEHAWKSGPVGRKLPEDRQRKVILSRWDKPVRTVSWEEVADDYARTLEGLDIEVPFNVVPKDLLPLLVERGIKIGEPEKGNAGDAARPAYDEWKNGASGINNVVRPNLSTETNEFGKPFVISKDGTTTFGRIDPESGLADVPIKLSEGEDYVDEDGQHHGYGLVHIEANRGEQIRSAGYASVEDFVEDIARNWTSIREGSSIADNQTYLLELTDAHNRTLFVQLSRDGSYWNINSAGIFRKKYSRNKPEVYSRPALGSSTGTDATGVNHGQTEGATVTSGNSPLTSEGKDTKNTYSLQENKEEKAKINTSDPIEAIEEAAKSFRESKLSDQEKKRSEQDATLLHQSIFGEENGELVSQQPALSDGKDTKSSDTIQENEDKIEKINTSDSMKAIEEAAEDFRNSQNGKDENRRNQPKYSLIGTKGAESMDKAEGTTVRMDNLKVAENMEKSGKDKKKIWFATGWAKGKDGKWRYEIPDFKDFSMTGNIEYKKRHPVSNEERERFIDLDIIKGESEGGKTRPLTEEELQEWAGLKAKIDPTGYAKESGKLSDFIDAPELFDAYPQLKDMPVEIVDLEGEFSGMYTKDGTILLDKGYVDKVVNGKYEERYASAAELKDTMVHEIQHAIQDIEGFSNGDNPHRIKPEYINRSKPYTELEDFIYNIEKDSRMPMSEIMNDPKGEWELLSEDAKKAAEKIIEEKGDIDNSSLLDIVQEKLNEYEIGNDAYERSAGEVEARNVERRRLMGVDTRRKKMPESTEDTPRDEQIVYNGSDPIQAISRASKLWKEERKVLGTRPNAHAETSNGGRMAIDAGEEPTIEDEYAHYSLSSSPTNTPLQTDENRRYHDLIGGKAFDWIEAHQNDLQSVIAMQKAILGDGVDPKDYENVFYAMNHMGGVVMQKENNYVRHYYSRINNAANEAAAKLRGSDKTKKYQKALDEVEDYIAMKCGLERNRSLYVRDNGSDQDKADFADLMDSLYNDLSARRITFADYLGKMDEFIRSRIDAGYMADKHDMSGLSNKNAAGYDDAAMTKEVMDTETLFGEALTDELWGSINSATDYTLNERYESGLMSKAEKERLQRQWHFYVPLQGWAEPTAEEMFDYTDHMMTSVGSPVLKRAGGRTSKADDPLAMIGANASRLIRDAELNRVHQTAVRLARGHAGNGLLEEMNTWYEKTGTDAQGNPIWEEAFPQWSPNATADDITQALQQFKADMEAKQQRGDARKTKRGLNIKYPMAVPAHVRQHIVNAWVGGEKVRLYVQGNPRAALALNGELRKGTDNKFVKAWDWVNRQMMGLNTSYNPEFIVSNGERDLEMAVNNLIVKEGREYTGRFLKNYFGIGGGSTKGNTGLLSGETLGMKNVGKRIEAFNGVWNRYYNETLDMSKESDRMFKEFMDNGGPTGYVTNQNLDKYKKQLYKGVKEKDGNVAAKSLTKLIENPFDWALSSIEELNTRVENLTRFAAYQTSRQGGRSVLQSIHDAKEVSVNFGTRGAGGNTSGAAGMTAAWGRHTFYFYNAGVQSLEMYARNIRKHPVKGVATMMLKPFMAGFAVSLWNMLNGSDDDTGMKSYAQLNPWVRRTNLIIPAGGGAFWTYPLPHEIRAFYGMGEAAAGMFFEETRDPNPALTMAGQITQMMPIDVLAYMSEQPKDITDLALRFGTTLLPSVIQSDIIQPAVNMNFYGEQIEREPNPYDDFEPRWQRTFMRDQNSIIYRKLKGLEQRTRKAPSVNSDPESPEMTKQQKGYIDISPALAKHMIDNIAGGAGAWVVRLGDVTRNGWEWVANEGENPIKESRGIPFVRTNYRSAQKDRGEGRQRARMYDLKKMMKKVEDNIKFYGNDKDVNPMHLLRYKELWDSEEGQLYREFYSDIKLIDSYEKKVKAAPEGDAKRNAQERLNEQRRVLLEQIDAKQSQRKNE